MVLLTNCYLRNLQEYAKIRVMYFPKGSILDVRSRFLSEDIQSLQRRKLVVSLQNQKNFINRLKQTYCKDLVSSDQYERNLAEKIIKRAESCLQADYYEEIYWEFDNPGEYLIDQNGTYMSGYGSEIQLEDYVTPMENTKLIDMLFSGNLQDAEYSLEGSSQISYKVDKSFYRITFEQFQLGISEPSILFEEDGLDFFLENSDLSNLIKDISLQIHTELDEYNFLAEFNHEIYQDDIQTSFIGLIDPDSMIVIK